MNEKPYDLEARTYAFALEIRLFLRCIHWDPNSWADVKQLLRSSGSVAANYIESIGAISNPESINRLRITKKEALESGLLLRLLNDRNPLAKEEQETLQDLLSETNELVKIFASILRKKLTNEPLP